MPRAEYTPSMVRLRQGTISEINKLIDELEKDPLPHGAHYAARLKTLMHLYFGTLPASYRGEQSKNGRS